MRIRKRTRQTLSALLALCALGLSAPAHAAMEDFPVVKLQSLDKVTARTMTFEANVGSTVKFGTLYIKIQACRKAPPIETPESAAFLQVWELTPKAEESQWIFSGWMFASSPALSPMDHPIYDVWVLDCLTHKTGEEPPQDAEAPAADPAETPVAPEGAAATETPTAPVAPETPAADTDIPVEEPPPSAE
ncbi:DUF2155 domain-containing protein [Micavibrio aeruginosavorus]|uniref:DUF2155 domain-containing protein n=1 Tax=Micavibrio aeruginosavorus TaxID=349221 RepID=UPI003F4ADBA3